MKKLVLLFIFLLGCGGGSTSSEKFVIAEYNTQPDLSQTSFFYAAYYNAENEDSYFRHVTGNDVRTYNVAGSINELRRWFLKETGKEFPWWASAKSQLFNDNTWLIWITGKMVNDKIRIHPISYYEEGMHILNDADSKMEHPHNWFLKPSN